MRTCPRVRHAHVWVHACKLARRREKSTKKIAAPRKLPPFFSSLFLFFLFIIRVFLRSRRFRDEKRDFEQVFDLFYLIFFYFYSYLFLTYLVDYYFFLEISFYLLFIERGDEVIWFRGMILEEGEVF